MLHRGQARRRVRARHVLAGVGGAGGAHRCLPYSRAVRGANTAARMVEASSTQAICPPAGAPAIRARSAVTRWLTGLTETKACSQPGMVRGVTKTLLARVSGNRTTVAALI